MAEIILVLGPSGTGKTHSIKDLEPAKTVVINADQKPLPWKGFMKEYNQEKKNLTATRDYDKIRAILKDINDNRPEITTVVIDTLYYIIMEEYMSKAKVMGFDKYTDMGLHVWNLIHYIKSLREDLNVIITSHTDVEDFHRVFSTPGKLVKEKIKPEGLSTVVLETQVDYAGGKASFNFMTQHEGAGFAKAPEGMFPSKLIPNNLKYVLACVRAYYLGEDIPTLNPQ